MCACRSRKMWLGQLADRGSGISFHLCAIRVLGHATGLWFSEGRGNRRKRKLSHTQGGGRRQVSGVLPSRNLSTPRPCTRPVRPWMGSSWVRRIRTSASCHKCSRIKILVTQGGLGLQADPGALHLCDLSSRRPCTRPVRPWNSSKLD